MHGARILVVADKGIEALDIQYRLINLGYAVLAIAVNGAEAIAKAAEMLPDLVLVDILLQGEIDGVTAAEQIHTRFDIPVIYLTAAADENTLQHAKITEPYGYIMKPFQERELHIVIDIALYKHRMERKLNESEKWLQWKRDARIAAQEDIQAQPEKLTTFGEELQVQQEVQYTTFQELQCRAAELDAAMSAIAAGAIIYDQSGNISRMNEFARNLFRYSSQDYRLPYQERQARFNMCKSDGTPYEAKEAPLFRALQGEIIRNEEMMITWNSESPIWISGTMAPIYDRQKVLIGVIFIFTNITEHKRQVEDLLASERELLKVTLNSLGEGVVAADREERIIFMNEAAASLTGYSEAEAIGAPLNKILYVFDDRTSEPMHVNVLSPKDGVPILVTRDLIEVPITMNSSPIKSAAGRIMGTVTVFQDISEKQRTERELLKADKLESLGIVAGGIAHDFNNILAAILSNIQLALIKLKRNEDIRKYLINTMETARKASELTKQLLTFSKGGAPVKKDASLIELIKDTTEFVLRGAKTKAEFAIPDDLWPASIDEGQISQVIHNLVLNAKQAMPKGGMIRISAENIVIQEDTRYNRGNYVKITVRDQGIGIVKENLSKIFDPFFTTKKDGNGLGLATSYSIIAQHNGYIEAESQEGLGTSFIIHLPAANTVIVPAESRKESAAAGGGCKILLMDDEESILNTVGEILKCYGYQVALTTDGAGAIELYKQAQRLGEPFDAVIMDLTIPGGMGGQEVIAHLRDVDPKIKAIVSSGYSNDPIITDYERFGFVGVVSKPYQIDELNEVLRKVLNT
jgi:PAS domain S-box-containing protein